MKKTVLSIALAAALAAAPALNAHEGHADAAKPAGDAAVPPAPKPEAKTPLTAEQKATALEALGWFVAQGQSPIPLELFGFSPEDLDSITKGLRRGAAGEEFKDFQKIIPQLDQLLKEKAEANRPKIEAKRNAKLAETKQKNQDYLREIDKQQGIQSTPSGLRYKILAPGTGDKPKPENQVKALYTGKLVDGTVFDSTASRGNEPATFPLNGVIKGWTEGLQKIGKGGKIILYVPAELGYGESGQGPIPPFSTLTFEVELVDILPPAPPPAPPAAAGDGEKK
jgi:FKBP-type peptidyl-prolyl cis-trans isomerase